MAKNAVDRVLSIQSHVVSGYVGNNAAAFPLQVRETRSLQHRHMRIRPSVHAIISVFSVTRPRPKSHMLIRSDLIPPHSICIDVCSRNEPIVWKCRGVWRETRQLYFEILKGHSRFLGGSGYSIFSPTPLWMRRFLQVKVLGENCYCFRGVES